ncbi:MAG: sulfatase-like hydrolase/transferase [Terracidiphilus sp.]
MMRRIAQAWGFAAIVLLPNYVDMTSAAGDARMRVADPLTRIALAHLTDMAIVGVLFAVSMAGLRSLKSWRRIRWSLMGILPVILLVRNLNVIPFEVSDLALAGVMLLWYVVLLFLIQGYPKIAERLSRAGGSLLAGFAVFAMVMTFQLVRAALWRPGPQAFATPIPQAPATKPRLVWILFDELGYKYTFGERDPSLQLPNFDRLRAESALYTDVTPIAYRTTRVVPSLMLGRAVTDIEYTAKNQYLVETEDLPHLHPFDANASLIGLAKQLGVTTSIVGWYIPYCPVFAKVATECWWTNRDAQDRGPTSLDASYLEDVWFPLRILFEGFLRPSRAWADEAAWNAEGHIASVRDVSRHALESLANSQADVIYLHIPSPHPHPFWNRRTGQFAVGGSYLDSLDYSDRLLGEMLAVLEKQPRWAATMLLVQGDHSWRTQMWRPQPGWSAEDERVSHGGEWDPRPVLLIHVPGEQDTETVTAPTSLMYVHYAVAAEIRAIAKH